MLSRGNARSRNKNSSNVNDFAWQGQQDLNPRPSVLETDALPTELNPSEAVLRLIAKPAARKLFQRAAQCCRIPALCRFATHPIVGIWRLH